MRETGGIIDVYESKIMINREKFYDNLKLSLKYDGQDDEFGIYAHGTTCFRNTIIEIFECLEKRICVELNNELFRETEDFLKWIYSEQNKQLGIEKHKEFIDRVDATIKEKGCY